MHGHQTSLALESLTSRGPGDLLAEREGPVTLRALHNRVQILGKPITLSNQLHRRRSSLLQAIINAAISRLDGQARVSYAPVAPNQRLSAISRRETMVTLVT